MVLIAMLTAACASTPPAPPCRPDSPRAEARLAFNEPELKCRPYFAAIFGRIQAKWVYPRSAGGQGLESKTEIDFDIAKDGRLALRNAQDAAHQLTLTIVDRPIHSVDEIESFGAATEHGIGRVSPRNLRAWVKGVGSENCAA